MAATLSLAFTTTPLPAGVKLIIEATRGVSPGINFLPRSEYKKILVTSAAPSSPQNLLSAYTAIYGALVSGQKIFIRAVTQNAAGQRAVYLSTTVTVT